MAKTASLHSSPREELYARYRNKLVVNTTLSRALVSYQANRNRPFYRWYKYKEGFSALLVEYVLDSLDLGNGHLLDPFASSGAAIMLAREKGFDTTGIELMPIGVKVVQARLASELIEIDDFMKACDTFQSDLWKVSPDEDFEFPHLRITQGAFSSKTETELNQFRTYLAKANLNINIKLLLELACLSVLEAISYTRKDGQYLRWDHRAPRRLVGKSFNKGVIPSFPEAMIKQLNLMKQDLTTPELFSNRQLTTGEVHIRQGSCLDLLASMPSERTDIVITSPPYCNRYDYTRTYALELAYLGIDEVPLKALRQALLSCTVENRSKVEELHDTYGSANKSQLINKAFESFEKQDALQEVLSKLDQLGKNNRLNNNNVPRMVHNYFLESAIVIFELARILSPGGYVVMVNDNVQYGGEEIPVDLILSEIARCAGLVTDRIWVLPSGKGNSSQQMGKHGRNELRKGVYLWRKE